MSYSRFSNRRQWSMPMVLLFALSFNAACTSEDPTVLPANGGVEVFVGGKSEGGMDALLTGRLVVVAQRCLGIRVDEEQGDRAVLWPQGTRITGEDPLTIKVDDVTLKLGDRVSLGGGESAVVGIELPPECQDMPPWLTSTVSS